VSAGYSLTDEGQEPEQNAELSSSGQVTELPGAADAALDYEREGGGLSEIVVDDPGTASGRAEQEDAEDTRGFFLTGQNPATNMAPGVLSRPLATATDSSGDVYVADAGHDRVQEFSSSGAFVRQWGGAGTGAGQFTNIAGIAVGGGNDVYVAEPTRIEEFSSTGSFIRQIGSEGFPNGGFLELTAIAVDPAGHLWALDHGGGQTRPYRIQELSAEGAYMRKAEIEKGGSGGDVLEPGALAVDAAGHLWIADTGNSRVQEFEVIFLSGTGASLNLLRTVGSMGTGVGQFSRPKGISIDPSGNVWVTDTENDRLEEFSLSGRFLSRFGRAGGEGGQMSEPEGLSVGVGGGLAVAETGNARVEIWTPSEPVSTPPIEPVPAASVETSGGLVESIEGEATGDISYQHEGGRLTEVEASESTTRYGYDEHGRLDKIELPDHTKAEIGYDGLGRVTLLRISVEGGQLETTEFEYPINEHGGRETIVRRPSKPAVHYVIGEEGSVLKWWDVASPPEIEEMGGSLWKQRTEAFAGTITPGDQSLEVEAHSFHGIASIQIVANGNQVVAEGHCEKAKAFECITLESIYVTETQDWPPGILQLEVIVTDADGGRSSERFTDNVPYTPPPADAEIEPPTFESILRFREEFGLDLNLKGNERAIDERIFNLIDDWHEPNTPEGQVARASMGRWGVPLRPVDVAELEYRERYLAGAAKLIPQWAEEHAPESYAGYYINHRQGGIIHVGFAAANQGQLVTQLVSEIGGQIAPGRISAFETGPRYSYRELLGAWHADSVALDGQPGLEGSLVSQGIDIAANRVEVQTEDVASMETFVGQHFDPGNFEVVFAAGHSVHRSNIIEPAEWTEFDSPPKHNIREVDNRLFSGDILMTAEHNEIEGECTLGWGATGPDGTKANGEQLTVGYGITAGHCEGNNARRFARKNGKYVEISPIGTVTRSAYHQAIEGEETDTEAFTIQNGISTPSWIFANAESQLRPGQPAVPVIGEPVCHSGSEGGYDCGTVTGFSEVPFEEGLPMFVWEARGLRSCEGDSGGPIWQPEGNTPLGILEGGPGVCGNTTYFTPLLESRLEEMGEFVGRNVGVFNAPGMEGLKFFRGG
jgi:YD repeat-containing protein